MIDLEALARLRAAASLHLPLKADGMGHYVLDGDGMAYQVRGWGALTGANGRRLGEGEAVAIQIARGELCAAAVNALGPLIEEVKRLRGALEEFAARRIYDDVADARRLARAALDGGGE